MRLATATIGALVLFAQGVHAQEASAKNPRLATVLSIAVPGLGQMYASREPGRGLAFLAGSLTAAGIGVATNQDKVGYDPALYHPAETINGITYPAYDLNRTKTANHNGLYLGVGIGAALWIWSAFDAAPTARRTNEESRRISFTPTRDGVAVHLTF